MLSWSPAHSSGIRMNGTDSVPPDTHDGLLRREWWWWSLLHYHMNTEQFCPSICSKEKPLLLLKKITGNDKVQYETKTCQNLDLKWNQELQQFFPHASRSLLCIRFVAVALWSVKKVFERKGHCDLFLPRTGSVPGRIWPKHLNTLAGS